MSKVACVTELYIRDCPFVFLQFLYIIYKLQIIIIICHYNVTLLSRFVLLISAPMKNSDLCAYIQ